MDKFVSSNLQRNKPIAALAAQDAKTGAAPKQGLLNGTAKPSDKKVKMAEAHSEPKAGADVPKPTGKNTRQSPLLIGKGDALLNNEDCKPKDTCLQEIESKKQSDSTFDSDGTRNSNNVVTEGKAETSLCLTKDSPVSAAENLGCLRDADQGSI